MTMICKWNEIKFVFYILNIMILKKKNKNI